MSTVQPTVVTDLMKMKNKGKKRQPSKIKCKGNVYNSRFSLRYNENSNFQ